MLSSRPLEPYFGFTLDEVSALCKEYDMDYDETMRWYDGYRISRNVSVCNPRAVTQAMRRGEFDVYWSQTGSFEVLKDYINSSTIPSNLPSNKSRNVNISPSSCCAITTAMY
jgi:hypothetical protein